MPGSSQSDVFLASLGISRIPLPVPFADAGGPVNVYALEDEGGWALFDCGIGTAEGEAALRAGATVLYTEDLAHGQSIETLVIQNPFLN